MPKTNVLLTTNILHKECGEPTGILFLAAYLRKNGFDVDIFDPEILGDKDFSGLSTLCKKMYGLAGISVLTSSNSSLLAVAKMAAVIHKELPDSIIACGGIGASLRFKEFVNIEFIDLVVMGEGENTVLEILSKILYACSSI